MAVAGLPGESVRPDAPPPGRTPWGATWPPGRRLPGHGLVARSRTGAFGTTWWGRRFIEAVDQAAGAGRLQRGRTYARAGQVVSLELAAGLVRAAVQGSRPDPYAVQLTFTRWDDVDRGALAQAVAAEPTAASAVLAGALPQALERLCDDVEIPLFPDSATDVRFSCTCPDLVDPCKHAAAVANLLAEVLDDDAFAILVLRGTSREQLLAEVVSASSGTASGTGPGSAGERPPDDLASWCTRRSPLPPPPAVPAPEEPPPVDALDSSVLGPGAEAVLALAREAATRLRRVRPRVPPS